MTIDPKTSYVIGIKIDSKEHYDRLIKEHSGVGILDINFQVCFEGYPEDYPCLVEYYTGDNNPLGIMYSMQLRRIIEDGYLIQIYKSERNPG